MPGAPFPVLNTIQPIFGCDGHKTIPPPAPVPPFQPHVVVWGVGWSQKMNFLWSNKATSKASSPESGATKPVQAGWGYACGRTHDSGPHPGHIWVNVLLPLIMLSSASKHEFGSGTVKVPGGSAPGFDMAVGVAWVMDLGLDCFDFPLPPAPTGLAISGTNSVRAGFTWSDFFRGAIQMLVDAAITWVINGVLSVAGEAIGSGAKGALGRAFTLNSPFVKGAPGFFARNGRFFVDAARSMRPAVRHMLKPENLRGTITTVVMPLVGVFGVGSPLGTSHPSAAWNQLTPEGADRGPVDETLNNLFR